MRATSYEVVTPAPPDEWTTLLRASPEAMAFHSPAWTAAVCAGSGWRNASRLYTFRDGRRLVLPLVARGRSRVVELASLPYGWGFGGAIADGAVTADDLAAVVADLTSSRAVRTSLRPNPLVQAAWPELLPRGSVTVPRTAHVLDLRGGFQEVWASRFTGTARTAVRKAERQGLEVECDSTGRLIPVFYELYERSIERWNSGSLAGRRARRRDRLDKYLAVGARAGSLAQVWVARHQGVPVASVLTLTSGENTNYWRGAMDESVAGPTRANYLLHRLAIEEACKRGCTTYHMGETGVSTSLAQFKSRFGARPVAYTELRVERLPVTRAVAVGRSVAATLRRSAGRRSPGGRA